MSENSIETEVPTLIEAPLAGEVMLTQAACIRAGHASTSMKTVSVRKPLIVAPTTVTDAPKLPGKFETTLRIIENHLWLIRAWLS